MFKIFLAWQDNNNNWNNVSTLQIPKQTATIWDSSGHIFSSTFPEVNQNLERMFSSYTSEVVSAFVLSLFML